MLAYVGEKMAKTVRVAFLGGVGEIGKNMTALEYGDDIIIVDCGVEFPREDSPGIDAIIPDITYIKENLHKLRGVVLTHGHEDHIGALPYYAEELDTSIYGTPLTLGLLQRKLAERNIPARLNRKVCRAPHIWRQRRHTVRARAL